MGIEHKVEKLQPIVFEQFKKSLRRGQLAHAYLFEGVSGTGKKELAIWLAASVLCQKSEQGIPCGVCSNCRRVFEHQHPDVMEIAPEGLSIKVDQVREIKAEFSKSGVESQQKIFIVEDAEKMTIGAANSLLKFLEEPDGKVIAFLLTTAKQRILPTILSRCQLVHFRPLSKRLLLEELKKEGIQPNQAALLVHLTNDLDRAVELNQDEWFNEAKKIAWKWITLMLKKNKQSFIFVQTDIMPHFKNREHYLLMIELLLAVYRDALMLYFDTVDTLAYPQHQQYLLDFNKGENAESLTKAIEIILNCRKKVESNVNAQGVLEQICLLLN